MAGTFVCKFPPLTKLRKYLLFRGKERRASLLVHLFETHDITSFLKKKKVFVRVASSIKTVVIYRSSRGCSVAGTEELPGGIVPHKTRATGYLSQAISTRKWGVIICMGAQARTDVLSYISLIPVFGYLWPGTSRT